MALTIILAPGLGSIPLRDGDCRGYPGSRQPYRVIRPTPQKIMARLPSVPMACRTPVPHMAPGIIRCQTTAMPNKPQQGSRCQKAQGPVTQQHSRFRMAFPPQLIDICTRRAPSSASRPHGLNGSHCIEQSAGCRCHPKCPGTRGCQIMLVYPDWIGGHSQFCGSQMELSVNSIGLTIAAAGRGSRSRPPPLHGRRCPAVRRI